MAKHTSIVLDDHAQDFVEKQVRSGNFESVDEVLRAGLELLEQNEGNLAALRSALEAGEASGPPVEFDFDEFLRRKRAAK
jgi:antitoxin ParD1/3/4